MHQSNAGLLAALCHHLALKTRAMLSFGLTASVKSRQPTSFGPDLVFMQKAFSSQLMAEQAAQIIMWSYNSCTRKTGPAAQWRHRKSWIAFFSCTSKIIYLKYEVVMVFFHSCRVFPLMYSTLKCLSVMFNLCTGWMAWCLRVLRSQTIALLSLAHWSAMTLESITAKWRMTLVPAVRLWTSGYKVFFLPFLFL